MCRVCAFAVAILIALSAGLVAGEYRTEFENVAQARAAGWEPISGSAGKIGTPAFSIVEDAAAGKSALRVEVTHEALWQGIVLNDAIDLRDVGRIEFDIKQNVRTQAPPWTLAVQIFFEDGGQALASPSLGLGDWHHISLALTTPPWEFSGREPTWGVTRQIRFYPYRHLDTVGEFMQLDGLQFVPRAEIVDDAPQGVTYRYESPPHDGADAAGTLLLDGQSDQQVTFPPYGPDPAAVVFDLGRQQTLVRVTLKAVAALNQNIASAGVEVSADGKVWQPIANLRNDATSPVVTEQTLSTACLGVGRFVRLKLSRPRVDLSLRLAEVELQYRDTVDADRAVEQPAYFDGPALADDDMITLRGRELIVAVDAKTGVIASIWRGDRRIAMRGWEHYVFENRDELKHSDEYADECRIVETTQQTLTLEGACHDLPGLHVRKSYRIVTQGDNEWLARQTTFDYRGERDDQFVTVLTHLALDEDYRRSGWYEGAQDRCDRVAADEVRFDRVTPANKALMFTHPTTRDGVTQYRAKVNGRFCLPYYSQASQESYNNTTYTRHGWAIGLATLKLSQPRDEGGPSVTVHTAIIDNARFGWEEHFTALPDYRTFVQPLTRPDWLRDVKAVIGDSYRDTLWDMAPRTARRARAIIDDGVLVTPANCLLDGCWGDLPVDEPAVDMFGGVTPEPQVERVMQAYSDLPRYLGGLYMWLQSVNRESAVFQQHPDWFVAANKQGEAQVIFPDLKPNFGRILAAPGHIDFLREQIVAMHRRYPQDVWYVDGGCGAVNLIDWRTLRVSHDYHGQQFVMSTRAALREINPDVIMFFNEADDRTADIGFAEIGSHFGREWRTAAAGMYAVKVRQLHDPLRLLSPLYLVNNNATEYLRLITGLGLVPTGAVDYSTQGLRTYAPYCSAAFETRGLSISDAPIAPDWRQDAHTPIEMYALRAGQRGLVLSVISHRGEAADERLHVKVPADVAAPGEQVVVVHHMLHALTDHAAAISDPAAKDLYQRTGWAPGAVTQWRSIERLTVDAEGWLHVEAKLDPERLHLFSVVREPVYYWSRDDLRANFLLPSVRGRETFAMVTGEDVPVELLVLAEPGMAVTGATLGGEATAYRAIELLGQRGAIIAIPPADRGRRLAVTYGQAGDIDAANVWRNGTLVYAGPPSDEPSIIEPSVEPLWPAVERIEQHQSVGADRDGVTILSMGRLGVLGGRPSVDVDQLTLHAEMPDETFNFYNHVHAGLEFAGLRRVGIRVRHNMVPQPGLYTQRHVLYEKHPQSFVGMFIDYGSADGYASRVALSMGYMSTERTAPQPPWGTKRPPQRYARLPETIFTGEPIDGMLDLERWAPDDWDGRVWLTLAMDNALRSRWLEVQITAINPSVDGSAVPVTDVFDLDELAKRRITAPRFDAPPQLDGDLDDAAWQTADASQGFFIVEGYGRAASQLAEVRVGYDQRYVYVAMTCFEREKNSYSTTMGAQGKPWFDDSVEFALLPPAFAGRMFHAIVGAGGAVYQESYEVATEKHAPSTIATVVHVKQHGDRFTIEAAVPLGPEGIPAPTPGSSWPAQFMRTRVAPDGTRQYTTWTASNGYHDASHFGTIDFE